MDSDTNAALFFVVWALLGIGAAAFFYGNKNAKLKRKIFPVYMIAVATIFIAGGYFIKGTVPLFVFVFVPLIALVNIGMTKFCDACGQTVISHVPFSTPRYCQKCGAKLT